MIILGMLSSIPYFFVGDNQHRRKHLVIFLILVIVSIVEGLGKYNAQLGQNNALIYNVGYVVIALSLKINFFFLVFQEKKEKRVVTFMWVVFFIWCLMNLLFFQRLFVFHNYSLAFGSIILIGLCFYYFYGIFFQNWYLEKNLLAVPEFWIISFLLFFYSASFLHFLSYNFYYERMDKVLFLQISFLIKVLGSIMYFVMGLAFYAPYLFKETGKDKSDWLSSD